MHLIVRNHICHFRLSVPPDLQSLFGCREIKRSLGTSDYSYAKSLASAMAFKIKNTIRLVRAAPSSISQDSVRSLIDDHIKTVAGSHAVQYGLRKGCPISPEAVIVQNSAASPVPQEASSVTLSDLVVKYAHENKVRWSASTINDYKGISKVLLRFVGSGAPVDTIKRATMRDYREVLKCLPLRFNTTSKYDKLKAQDVLALGLPSRAIISTKVVNKYLTYASGLFSWAVDMDYMADNPAARMEVKNTSDTPAATFTHDDLESIFNCPRLGDKHPYRFWLPLLGLYTGARVNELCQLYVSDVRSKGGIWYLDINADTPDKTLKNKSSKRIVPLHPDFIELGFIEYVQGLDPDGRVFPEFTLSKSGKDYSNVFSKWFNRLLSDLGIKPPVAKRKAEGVANKTFHTFRHTFITNVGHNGMGDHMLKAIVGHAEKGVTFTTYMKRHSVHMLYSALVERLDYGVDLSHLKSSLFVVK